MKIACKIAVSAFIFLALGACMALADAATHFALESEHGGTEMSGVPFWIKLTAVDDNEDVDTSYEGVKNITWGSSHMADGNQTFVAGVATVPGFLYYNPPEGYVYLYISDGTIGRDSEEEIYIDIAPSVFPWTEDFEDFSADFMYLTDANYGWYAYNGYGSWQDQNLLKTGTSIVQNVVFHSGSYGGLIAPGDLVSNNVVSTNVRFVSVEMYIRPQLWTSSVYPSLVITNSFNVANAATRFVVNSNGYFVVANGSKWREIRQNADGTPAFAITNTVFAKVQLKLRYKNNTWKLRAWTNDTYLVADTPYVNFVSNLSAFSGMAVYNGTANSYLDDIVSTSLDYSLLPKINGIPFDALKTINGAQPAKIIGVVDQ